MSDIVIQNSFYLLPDDMILIISNYHSLYNKLLIRSINKSCRDLISFITIRKLKLNEKIKNIFIGFKLSLGKEIFVPFGLLVEWNIALQQLTNGDRNISYIKTIIYIKKWLILLKPYRDKSKLTLLSINAAIRWGIGQRKY